MNTENSFDTEFNNCINDFVHNIDSLRTTLPLLQETINKSYKDSLREKNKLLKEKCEFVSEENHYLISPDNRREYQILLKKVKNSKTASIIVKRNYIVSLISQFDSFIASMIRTLFYVKPELLNTSEKSLSFSELEKFSHIGDAREFIIEKEIESVLRNNHTDHFKWFETKLKINLRKDLPIWPQFIELTERRNLYVHTNGIISSQYVNLSKKSGFKFENYPVIGESIDETKDYFNESFECIYELAVKLNQVIRRSLFRHNTISADHSISIICFDLLENEQYNLAKSLLDFDFKYNKKHSSEDITCQMLLNRAQAYRWLGKIEKSKEIVNSKDWSASSDKLKLASNVLNENYAESSKLMRKIGSNSEELLKANYRDWPIFKDFRETDFYKDVYKELFEDEFEIVENKK